MCRHDVKRCEGYLIHYAEQSLRMSAMPASGWLQTIVKLAKMRPCVIRGNASEIMALAGAAGATRGVDSTAESEEALALGKQLSLDLGAVVAISGKDDYVRPSRTLTGS